MSRLRIRREMYNDELQRRCWLTRALAVQSCQLPVSTALSGPVRRWTSVARRGLVP